MNAMNDVSQKTKLNLLACALAGIVIVSHTAYAQDASQGVAKSGPKFATDAALQTLVEARFKGDYSGLCVAVAVIDATDVKRAITCADADIKSARTQKVDASSLFEIGSISKTMLAALVADLIDQGKMKLDAPITDYLPAGTKMPPIKGRAITVQDIVTHTSGLPPLPAGMESANPADPYAKLSEAAVLEALPKASLLSDAGKTQAYSNFAMMVLSLAVTHVAKQDLPSLMSQKLFAPAGMKTAYIGKPNSTQVKGHSSSRNEVSSWTISNNLAGVGMVRASLDDIVAFARVSLGKPMVPNAENTRLAKLIETAQKPLFTGGMSDAIGMNWFIRKTATGVQLIEHGGGTGGFSAYLGLDHARGRAVVILTDASSGGIGKFGDALFDSQVEGGQARKIVDADPKMLAEMAGEYLINDTLPLTITIENGRLYGQAKGQGKMSTYYINDGTFVVQEVEARLRPIKTTEGYRFMLLQGGGVVPVARVSAATASEKPAVTVSAADLKKYEGVYPLFPGLKLKVFVEGDKLMAQATGQSAFPLKAVGDHVFRFDDAGIKATFIADAENKFGKMRFQQGGNDVTAARE